MVGHLFAGGGFVSVENLLARHPLPAIPCTIFDGYAARPGLAVDEAVRLQGPVVGEKRPCRPLSAPGERPEGGTATRGCRARSNDRPLRNGACPVGATHDMHGAGRSRSETPQTPAPCVIARKNFWRGRAAGLAEGEGRAKDRNKFRRRGLCQAGPSPAEPDRQRRPTTPPPQAPSRAG